MGLYTDNLNYQPIPDDPNRNVGSLNDPTGDKDWTYDFIDNQWWAYKDNKGYDISKYPDVINKLNTAYPNGQRQPIVNSQGVVPTYRQSGNTINWTNDKYVQLPNKLAEEGASPSGGGTTTLSQELEESGNKMINEQKNFNIGKSLWDATNTFGALLQNKLAKRPEPINAPKLSLLDLPSTRDVQMNQLNTTIGSNRANTIQLARESGRPELIPGIVANLSENEIKGSQNIDIQELERQGKLAEFNTGIMNQQAQLDYGAKIQDAQMMDQININRGKTEAELLSKLGGIGSTYMQNKVGLWNMGDVQKVYKAYLDNKITKDQYLSFLKINAPGVYDEMMQDNTTKKTYTSDEVANLLNNKQE